MLDAADVLVPRGELEPSLFPLDDATALTAKVRAWIDKARTLATAAGLTDEATLDAASEAYVYWKATSAAVQRILASPTSSSIVDKGAAAYSAEQIRQLVAERDRWAAQWLLYVPDVVDTDGATATGPNETGATRSYFTW